MVTLFLWYARHKEINNAGIYFTVMPVFVKKKTPLEAIRMLLLVMQCPENNDTEISF